MTVLAVVPARGGSKRLPRKNIRAIAGRPMLGWVVGAALKAGAVDALVVSTDDQEIAQLAESLGAKVVHRPAELATDSAWTEPVIRHAVESFEKESGRVELVVWLNASIPEVRAADIDRAVWQLREGGFWEILAVDSEWHATSAVRVLRRSCLDQRALSVNVGLIPLDYLDIHTEADRLLAEERLEQRRQQEGAEL